jgi:hypothetical protein
MRRPLAAAAKPAAGKSVALRAAVTILHAAAKEGESAPAGPPSFESLVYSGGRLPGYTAGLDHDVVVDLAGMKPVKNLVANLDHNPKQRVGHVTAVANDKQTLKASGLLSAATPHRAEVADSSKDGFQWEVSMENLLSKIVFLSAGQSMVVNGQTVSGPVYIAKKSQLTGLAFVSNGADGGNKVKIAASAAGATMNEFEKWLVAKGFDPAELSEQQTTVLKASFDAEQAGSGGGRNTPTTLEAVVAAQRRENERVEKITLLAQQAMRDHRQHTVEIELLARQAESDQWDPNRFELELLRATRPQSATFRTTNRSAPDGRVLEAALCLSAGLPNIEKHYSAEVLTAVDDHKLRNISIQQVILQAAAANGYSCRPGERILPGNLETILQYAFPPATAQLRASFSNVSLPSLLGNVANKEIVAGFMEEDQTWREVGIVKPVNNFYKHTVHRLLDDLEYEDLGAGGEIKHGKLGEETYTRQAKTRAIMLGLTREQIINDDTGAFDDLRTRLGRGAGRKLKNIFWTTFISNATLFTAARGNFISGATTTLLVDGVGLELGLTAFRKLKSSTADGSKRIGGRPDRLVVPPELEFTADRLHVSGGVNTGGAATATSVPDGNIHQNKYRPVVVPELSDPAFPGNSATAWYLLRDPRILAAIVVSALGGRVEPTVESTTANFNTLGIQFRGWNDVGCDHAEYLAGVKSKGAV